MKADEDDWQTEVSNDHWSKQLLVNDAGATSFNLTFARNNVVQSNLMTSNYAYDPNDVNVNATTRYNQFDSWFVNEFLKNDAYFGEGKDAVFVDP